MITDKFIAVLNRLHPRTVNVKSVEYANTYEGSRTEAKIAYKQAERDYLLSVYREFAKDSVSTENVYALDCKRFELSAALSLLNVKVIIPNWAAKTVTASKAYQRLNKTKIHVFGASSHDLVHTICSIPASERPQFRFVWLDICNVYKKEQDGELFRFFAYRLFCQTAPSVLGLTYMAERDKGPLNNDKNKLAITRAENVALRVLNYATIHGYSAWHWKELAGGGTFTSVFVVRPGDPVIMNVQRIFLNTNRFGELTRISEPENVLELTMVQFEELSQPLVPQSKEVKGSKVGNERKEVNGDERKGSNGKTSGGKRRLLAGAVEKPVQPLRAPRKKFSFVPPVYPYLFGKKGKFAHKGGEMCYVVKIAWKNSQKSTVRKASDHTKKCVTCFPVAGR